MKLSKSAVNSFLKCRREFKYQYIDERPQTTNEHMQLGLDIHQIAENFVKQGGIYSDDYRQTLQDLADAYNSEFDLDVHLDNLAKFFEDVFPVESKLETVTKFNKKGNDAKEASLSIGSNLGVKKNMKFDIYKQNLSVGEDSRENIGHGEIKKDPEQDSSILVIQDGGKEIATILQGDDPNVGIVVVSRGHIDKVGNVFKRFGLGGLFWMIWTILDVYYLS